MFLIIFICKWITYTYSELLESADGLISAGSLLVHLSDSEVAGIDGDALAEALPEIANSLDQKAEQLENRKKAGFGQTNAEKTTEERGMSWSKATNKNV